MAKPYYLLIFVLAIAIAYSQSQTSGSGSAAGQPTPANNAGSIYGNSTSGNQQAPGQGNTPSSQPLPGTSQSTPAATGTQPAMKPGSATDASGGGVAGAAGSRTGQAEVTETPNPSANPPVSDSELQSQIQNALSKEPTLSGDSVRVSVAEGNIEMSGNVATPREKLTASRIVQSYAGNKKVVSHVTIGAHSGANPSTPAATHDNANPSANPEPNKGKPPAATQPPRR
jgi:hypothetical protein